MTEHIADRPSWNCLACAHPWPCDPAREALATEISGVQLAMHMWTNLEEAAGDLNASMGEMFDRFILWTRPYAFPSAAAVSPLPPSVPEHNDQPNADPPDWPKGSLDVCCALDAEFPHWRIFWNTGDLRRYPEPGYRASLRSVRNWQWELFATNVEELRQQIAAAQEQLPALEDV